MKNSELFPGAIVEMKVSGHLVPCDVLGSHETTVRVFKRWTVQPTGEFRRATKWTVRNRRTGRTIVANAARCRRLIGWKKSARDAAIARGHKPRQA